MARRKLGERNIRSLTRYAGGKSYMITLPIDIIRKWKWQHRQKLELSFNHKKKRITVADWKKKSSER